MLLLPVTMHRPVDSEILAFQTRRQMPDNSSNCTHSFLTNLFYNRRGFPAEFIDQSLISRPRCSSTVKLALFSSHFFDVNLVSDTLTSFFPLLNYSRIVSAALLLLATSLRAETAAVSLSDKFISNFGPDEAACIAAAASSQVGECGAEFTITHASPERCSQPRVP